MLGRAMADQDKDNIARPSISRDLRILDSWSARDSCGETGTVEKMSARKNTSLKVQPPCFRFIRIPSLPSETADPKSRAVSIQWSLHRFNGLRRIEFP